VQRRPVDRQAAADTVGQTTATVVEEALPPDRIRPSGDGGSDAELSQSTPGIAG
jgi:hypothetical protein